MTVDEADNRICEVLREFMGDEPSLEDKMQLMERITNTTEPIIKKLIKELA